MNNQLTKEDLDYSFNHSITIGDLKEFIKKHNLPDDGKILIQRVEDFYYKNRRLNDGSTIFGWHVLCKEGEAYYNALEHNKRIDEGYYLDKEEFPDIKPEDLKKYSPKQLEKLKEQYTVAWGAVKYKDEDKHLFIDLHY